MSKSPVAFFKEVRAEMTKVTWLSREETIRLTAVVVVASLLVAAYVGALDFIFTKLTALAISFRK